MAPERGGLEPFHLKERMTRYGKRERNLQEPLLFSLERLQPIISQIIKMQQICLGNDS
jgi:hypothetical protein